ncbi:MAG: PocR ligand-binding domain-containing protein [Candidatus Gastranaerophilales bacterium]|nr:PocR ligand-binding domain-containing protein [Candidatus Gastranaerophilales bacterium]
MTDYQQEKNIKLSDVVNVELLQKFQDAFADYMNIAIVTFDNEKQITAPSNFTDFCIKCSADRALCYEKCNENYIQLSRLAAQKSKPVIYRCSSGLTDFAVPIMLNGKHIGSILGGQILTDEPQKDNCIVMAQQLGINEKDYIEALNELQIIPSKQVEAIAQLVFLFANLVSEMANKNLELIRNSNREKLLRKIIETMRTTLDVDKILYLICNELAQLFNVQRSIIVEFSDEKNDGYIKRGEFRAKDSIKNFAGSENYENGTDIVKVLVSQKKCVVFDNISEADIPDKLKKFYENTGLKSMISTVVKKNKKVWGAIILFDYENYRHWTNDEISLLKAVASQIYISVYQTELYHKTIQQAEREKAILNNLPFIAWLKDKDGRFLAVNEIFVNQFDLTVEDIIGKTDLELFPADIAQGYMNDDLKVMQARQKFKVEEEVAQKDGTRWHETFKTPLFDQDGQIIGTTGFAIDITERKEIELIKNEFISTISHELRTPLTSIRGALGLVLSEVLGTLPKKVKELLNIASNNSVRLVNLINDILDLDKIKAGKMDFEFKEYEVMPLVEETLNLNETYAKQFNVQYKITDRLDNVYINVDKNRFIQVLTNLLSNAAKFSFPKEVVNISVKKEKHNILVSVINKGAGIPKEAYSKIFESFSQVDSSNKRRKGGSGLGLIITKSIVQQMGGEIGFSSKLNDETKFYFEFPEIIRDEKEKRVLIFKDNNITALNIQTMFKELGYNSDIALSVNDAERLLQNENYDLAIIEFNISDKNSLLLLNELKNHKNIRDLPVIIVSSSKPDAEIIKKYNNIFDWLEKSFDLGDLKMVVNNVMNEKNKTKVEVLHVENDEDILNIISLILKDVANFTKVTDLETAADVIKTAVFDIIILDYVFPGSTCEKLIPIIKSGSNKDAKLIVFSAYEESKKLAPYVDAIFLKTHVSTEQFKGCIEKLIQKKVQESIED